MTHNKNVFFLHMSYLAHPSIYPGRIYPIPQLFLLYLEASRVDKKSDYFSWEAERGSRGSSVATAATSVDSAHTPTLREGIAPKGRRRDISAASSSIFKPVAVL